MHHYFVSLCWLTGVTRKDWNYLLPWNEGDGHVSPVPVGSPAYIAEISRGRALDWSRATLIHTSAVAEDWETSGRGRKALIVLVISMRGWLVVSNQQMACGAYIILMGMQLRLASP